jgi:hypothetical protein
MALESLGRYGQRKKQRVVPVPKLQGDKKAWSFCAHALP